MAGWNTRFLLVCPNFRCYVSFREGNFSIKNPPLHGSVKKYRFVPMEMAVVWDLLASPSVTNQVSDGTRSASAMMYVTGIWITSSCPWKAKESPIFKATVAGFYG